jgi:hypothetical protein
VEEAVKFFEALEVGPDSNDDLLDEVWRSESAVEVEGPLLEDVG